MKRGKKSQTELPLATNRSILFTPVCAQVLSYVRLFGIPWTVAHQAPLSMGFSRQVYWSGLPFPAPMDLPDPGIEPVSPVSPVMTGGFFTTETPRKPFFLVSLFLLKLTSFNVTVSFLCL